jgi:hypothetical protein
VDSDPAVDVFRRVEFPRSSPSSPSDSSVSDPLSDDLFGSPSPPPSTTVTQPYPPPHVAHPYINGHDPRLSSTAPITPQGFDQLPTINGHGGASTAPAPPVPSVIHWHPLRPDPLQVNTGPSIASQPLNGNHPNGNHPNGNHPNGNHPTTDNQSNGFPERVSSQSPIDVGSSSGPFDNPNGNHPNDNYPTDNQPNEFPERVSHQSPIDVGSSSGPFDTRPPPNGNGV